jgi:hypothetical protein
MPYPVKIVGGSVSVISDGLTDAELRATPVPVDTGVTDGLTDAELRATPVPVDAGFTVGLTDAELRATPVPVDAGFTVGLTDVELRATPVSVDTGLGQGLTNAQYITATSGGAFIDRSIANLGGASQQLMAANANRKLIMIANIATNQMGINLIGGVAAIGVAGTITIPAGAIILIDKYPPTAQINIIGTLNDDVTAYEL